MKCRPFTLLEIIISVAVLAMASVGIGWQMKGMLAIHHFDKSIHNFFADLRKAQLVALADRVDIDLNLYKDKEGYHYFFHSDDPLVKFVEKPSKLPGITEIKSEKKKLETLQLHIFPSGRIGPEEKITLLQTESRGVILDLSSPLWIELKKI